MPKQNRRSVEAEARQRRVLKEAHRQFLENGYTHTSLNSIIARAGGSKATLQKYFGNKAGLFAAVITEPAKRFVTSAQIRTLKGMPHQVLQTFGETVLSFYFRPDALHSYRGVIAEGHRNPSMAKAFYHEGHAQITAALAIRLDEWHHQKIIHCIQPAADADRFLHILRAGIYEQTLIGLRRAPSRKEIVAQVSDSVRVFLFGLTKPAPG